MERLLRHTGPDGLLTENGLRLFKFASPEEHAEWLREALKRGDAPLQARWAQARSLGAGGWDWIQRVVESERYTPVDVAGWPEEEQPEAGGFSLVRWLTTPEFVLTQLQAGTGPDGLLAHPAELAARWRRGRGWPEGVNEWIKWTVQQTGAPGLLTVYRLVEGLGFSLPWAAGSVAAAAAASGKYSSSGVAATWPPNQEVLARVIVLEQLKFSEAEAPRAKRARTASTWKLRSGASAQNLELASKAVVDWTSNQYQATQDFLRGDRKAEVNNAAGTRRAHADALKQHFQRFAAVAPRGAKSGIQYLYRGVHGPQADEMEATGGRTDKGFVAFSWDRRVALRFSQGRLLLRLAVRDVPAGTPWIWFGRRNNPESLAANEKEVLLPPGRLTGVGAAADGPVEVLVVRYAATPWW